MFALLLAKFTKRTTDYRHGTSGNLKNPGQIIWCQGLALVFRTFTALSTCMDGPSLLTGDHTLRHRDMTPLYTSLSTLGAKVEAMHRDGKAPAVVWSKARSGVVDIPGVCQLAVYLFHSSRSPIRRKANDHPAIPTCIFPAPYIRQTLESMKSSGHRSGGKR